MNSIKTKSNDVFGADNEVGRAELNQIANLAERPDIFPVLVKSACPSIYGHDIVKAGLILSLFGGTDYRAKTQDFDHEADEELENDDHNTAQRPDIHLLMIGDPGIGKSQMLKHITNISP